jgi:hypothetical protein
MLKWLFLLFIGFGAFLANCLPFSSRLPLDMKVIQTIGANSFVVAVLFCWLGAYYPHFNAKGFRERGYLTLLFASGLAFAGAGYYGLRRGSCDFMISERPTNLGSKIAIWAIEHHACSWLSIALVTLGFFVAWPSVRRLAGAFLFR